MQSNSADFEAHRAAADRESVLIEKYRDRIAGFGSFPGMTLLGLAWRSSSEPGAAPIEHYIDALYRKSSTRYGHADVGVRTWLVKPSTLSLFSADPYPAAHLRDFIVERKEGELDLEHGIPEVAAALSRADRQPGTLLSGVYAAEQHSVRHSKFADVVTVAGYAQYFAALPPLIRGLESIPRLRG